MASKARSMAHYLARSAAEGHLSMERGSPLPWASQGLPILASRGQPLKLRPALNHEYLVVQPDFGSDEVVVDAYHEMTRTGT